MKNAIIFNNVDREDGWISGIVLKVTNTSDYDLAYEEVKHILELPETVKQVIDDKYLLDDLFGGDETYKFTRTYWEGGLYYEFENSEGNIETHKFAADFISVLN